MTASDTVQPQPVSARLSTGMWTVSAWWPEATAAKTQSWLDNAVAALQGKKVHSR